MLRSVVESATHLNTFAQVALVLFVLAFVSVLLREKLRSKSEVEHLERLPLADDSHERKVP